MQGEEIGSIDYLLASPSTQKGVWVSEFRDGDRDYNRYDAYWRGA